MATRLGVELAHGGKASKAYYAAVTDTAQQMNDVRARDHVANRG